MSRHLLLVLAALTLASPVYAQAAAPMAPAPSPANLSQALSTLADQPATHTGFVFDRSTLQLAQNLLESNGMDPHRAAAALSSISVDSYHYPQAAFYTPESMAALLASYHAAGWKHLTNVNQNPANTAQPKSVVTDLWLHFSGADIDGVTVLTPRPAQHGRHPAPVRPQAPRPHSPERPLRHPPRRPQRPNGPRRQIGMRLSKRSRDRRRRRSCCYCWRSCRDRVRGSRRDRRALIECRHLSSNAVILSEAKNPQHLLLLLPVLLHLPQLLGCPILRVF